MILKTSTVWKSNLKQINSEQMQYITDLFKLWFQLHVVKHIVQYFWNEFQFNIVRRWLEWKGCVKASWNNANRFDKWAYDEFLAISNMYERQHFRDNWNKKFNSLIMPVKLHSTHSSSSSSHVAFKRRLKALRVQRCFWWTKVVVLCPRISFLIAV